MDRYHRTKILATLGPSSSSPEIIHKMIQAGASAFRLNFSHGTHEDHAQRFQIIRQAESHFNRPIGIVADLQGPKLRIDILESGFVTLTKGQIFTFDLNNAPGNEKRVYLPHPEIFKAIQPGNRLFIADGAIHTKVIRVGTDYIETYVEAGGVISNKKGVNIPDTPLPLSSMTPKDHRDLDYALELGVDWIALSFVQRVEDVIEAKERINGRARLMVKIEKPLALLDINHIVDLADGVMVARGDLGVEMLMEQVPIIQKRLVRLCRQVGKPVVVATQMLESMILASSPTRAEVSDVATAVYDGTDTVMLSAESASGAFPVQAIEVMRDIIQAVENDPYHGVMLKANYHSPLPSCDGAISDASGHVAKTLDADAIVTYTQSGNTTLQTSRGRPHAPIISLTPYMSVARALTLSWGVYTVKTDEFHDIALMDTIASHIVHDQGFATLDSLIVITAGIPFNQPGTTNMLRVVKVKDHL